MLLDAYLDDAPHGITRAYVHKEGGSFFTLWGSPDSEPDVLLAEATSARELEEFAVEVGIVELRREYDGV